MKLVKEWLIPTLIVFLLAGVVIAVAVPLVNGTSDEGDRFEERREERGSFDRERDGEQGEREDDERAEREGGREERDAFSFGGLMGGIVKQVMLMGIGGGITLLILAIIRQFSHRKTPPIQTDTA